jgi:hypothetical protein
MGEGKTSVIVPMLCLKLADGKNLLQLTVLRTLFNTNLKYLKFRLGLFLNRKIYVFPFKRDINLDLDALNIMENKF